MKIKIKDKENGKRIVVDVAHSCCEKYKCFYPHHWITQSLNYNHTQVDKNYSCGTRNYRGCPDNKELKDAPQNIIEQNGHIAQQPNV